MRLSSFLFTKMPRGHIFRGKYRLVKEVTPIAAAALRYNYAREEENMLYLRHPYLSLAQSRGHSKALGKQEKSSEETLKKLTQWKRKHVTIEERLRHLRVTDAWD